MHFRAFHWTKVGLKVLLSVNFLTFTTLVIEHVYTYEGYFRVITRDDWRHNGPPHWIFHPQWSRDHLLSHQNPLQISQGWKRDVSQ